jgi:hypothetical protein
MSGLEPAVTPSGADHRKRELLSAFVNQSDREDFIRFFLGKCGKSHNFAPD